MSAVKKFEERGVERKLKEEECRRHSAQKLATYNA